MIKQKRIALGLDKKEKYVIVGIETILTRKEGICMSSYVDGQRTAVSGEKLEKVGEKIGKIKKIYSNLEEERTDIEREATFIKENVFGDTWNTVGDRWKEKFNDLYENYLEKECKKDETIQSEYRKSTNDFKDQKRKYWNTDVLAQYIGVSKGTVENWKKGMLPNIRSRDSIIKLGFLLKYTREQMDRLLDSAQLPKLYVKGSQTKKLGRNLNDYIYYQMIYQKYPFGKESFEVATTCIYYINSIVQKEAQKCREQKKKTDIGSDKCFTFNILNDILDNEEEQMGIQPTARAWTEAQAAYVKANIEAFAFSYNNFFAKLTQAFEEQYEIVKRGGNAQINFADQEGDKLYIKNLTQGWGKEFYELLCTAVNTSNHVLKRKMVMPSREDIITLGLLLDCDYEKMKEYLALCSMPELRASDKVEAIIQYTLKYEKKVSPELTFSLLGKVLDTDHMAKDRSAAILANPALQSLQTYEWIKLAIKATEIEDEATWITDRYPEVQLFNWMIKTLRLE